MTISYDTVHSSEIPKDTPKFQATMPVEVIPAGNDTFSVTCPDTHIGEGQKNVKLTWQMQTDGWEVIGVYGLTGPMFVNKAKDGNGYTCKDKNNNIGEKEYKYTVIVGNEETKQVASLDPTIKNGGI